MSRKALLAMVPVLLLMVFLAAAVPVSAQSGTAKRALVTQQIDEENLIQLVGNTRPEVRAENDRGPVADDLKLEHMYLLLRRAPEQQKAVDELIEELHNPKSSLFHKWLTAEEVAERFGLADQDIRTVTNWLDSHGFTVNFVYPSNGVIDFSGPASAVREAFHTQIHNLSVRGEAHIANVSDPKIPQGLAGVIRGVVSMNDFRPRPQVRHRPQFTFYSGGSEFTDVVPDDLYTIYNFYPLFAAKITGEGQTVAVFNDSDVYTLDDWYTFRKTFGLDKRFPQGSLQQIHPQPSGSPLNGGTCTDPGINPNGDDVESILDAEWASAAAPNAAILEVTCANTNTNFGPYIAMQNLLTGPGRPPEIFSLSYGGAESSQGAAFNEYTNVLYELAVLEGVSIYVSAGDGGPTMSDEGSLNGAVYGINVNSLASTAHNVAVGGTDFGTFDANTTATYWAPTDGKYYQSALSYVPEITWNTTCAGSLVSASFGYSPIYGPTSFCNSALAAEDFSFTFEIFGIGSGGPSGCAYGTPSIPNVVSGTCQGFAKPSYQHSVPGLAQDGVRDLPDVSLFAGDGFLYDGYVFCYSDPTPGQDGAPCVGSPSNWTTGWGGTSFSSPIVAGIQALINQAAGGSQGNPNYVLYALAAEQYNGGGTTPCNATLGNQISPRCIFNDVTQGDTEVPCTALVSNGVTVGLFNCYLPGGTYGVSSVSDTTYVSAYQATPGWDFSTGLGSVNAYNLVRNWPGSNVH